MSYVPTFPTPTRCICPTSTFATIAICLEDFIFSWPLFGPTIKTLDWFNEVVIVIGNLHVFSTQNPLSSCYVTTKVWAKVARPPYINSMCGCAIFCVLYFFFVMYKETNYRSIKTSPFSCANLARCAYMILLISPTSFLKSWMWRIRSHWMSPNSTSR